MLNYWLKFSSFLLFLFHFIFAGDPNTAAETVQVCQRALCALQVKHLWQREGFWNRSGVCQPHLWPAWRSHQRHRKRAATQRNSVTCVIHEPKGPSVMCVPAPFCHPLLHARATSRIPQLLCLFVCLCLCLPNDRYNSSTPETSSPPPFFNHPITSSSSLLLSLSSSFFLLLLLPLFLYQLWFFWEFNMSTKLEKFGFFAAKKAPPAPLPAPAGSPNPCIHRSLVRSFF